MVSTKPIVIYALRCPVSHRIRYIGKASHLSRRLSVHIHYAKWSDDRSHKLSWIRWLLRQDLRPEILTLVNVPAAAHWQTIERFLIASARSLGFKILNIADGGEYVKLTPEGKRRISENRLRVWSTPEGRAMYMRVQKASYEKRMAAVVEARNTPESKRKASEHSKRLWNDPEYKVRKSANAKAAWNKPGARQKRGAVISGSQAATWSDPVKGAKRRSALTSPEFRAKMAAVNKANWEKRKANAP